DLAGGGGERTGPLYREEIAKIIPVEHICNLACGSCDLATRRARAGGTTWIMRKPAQNAPAGRPFDLVTSDGYSLGATLFAPPFPGLAPVIVNGAPAVPQGYYRRFAEFLAARGLRVLTYDYRGVGASRPAELAGFDATMTDWARLDAAAA